MLQNYLKIAFRNLWKNKLFSFINIMGLGLAIPFALLALMHLQSTFEFVIIFILMPTVFTES